MRAAYTRFIMPPRRAIADAAVLSVRAAQNIEPPRAFDASVTFLIARAADGTFPCQRMRDAESAAASRALTRCYG